MDIGAIDYILRILVQRVLGIMLFLLGSSWILGTREIIYFILYILVAIISGIALYKVNSTTINERRKINTDSPIWDKVLLTIYWFLAYFGIYFVAGKYYETSQFDILYWIGIVLYIIATIFTLRAMIVNTFLESTARLQTDRKQIVCKEGPYSIVRHPTYLSILIWCMSISLIFPSKYVILIAVVIGVIIVIRTYLEDNMLKIGLEGYMDYTREVRYRLIPFIW
ncbi:methyltransferase [uncultured Clostridium sp.]|uniref:methyltransferase family protein n=1 Tax=uncultured Clostridium sp. TaxID=59620 RepID=UPI003217A817